MNTYSSSILIDNNEFKVNVKFSTKYKRLAMSFNEKLELVIRSPIIVNANDISNFIASNTNWILNSYNSKKNNSMINLQDNYKYLLGKKYQINWIEITGNFKYSIDSDCLNLYVRKNFSKKNTIIKFLTKNYSDFVFKKLNYWSTIMGLSFNDFKFKWAETSFGKCFYNKKIINISPRICLYPENIIDYLLIHELSHLIHPNHSKEFWNNVEKYYKEYKMARKYLKIHY